MLMPSIFGENLFNDDWMNFGFPEVDKALYGIVIVIIPGVHLKIIYWTMSIIR